MATAPAHKHLLVSLLLELPFLGGSNHEDNGRLNSHSQYYHYLAIMPNYRDETAKRHMNDKIVRHSHCSFFNKDKKICPGDLVCQQKNVIEMLQESIVATIGTCSHVRPITTPCS